MLSLPVNVFFFGYFTFVFRIMKVHCLVYWCLCKLKKNIKLARDFEMHLLIFNFFVCSAIYDNNFK